MQRRSAGGGEDGVGTSFPATPLDSDRQCQPLTHATSALCSRNPPIPFSHQVKSSQVTHYERKQCLVPEAQLSCTPFLILRTLP